MKTRNHTIIGCKINPVLKEMSHLLAEDESASLSECILFLKKLNHMDEQNCDSQILWFEQIKIASRVFGVSLVVFEMWLNSFGLQKRISTK